MNDRLSYRKALYWEKLDNNVVKCNVCANECVINENKLSRCLSRKNIKGEMNLNTYGIASSLAVDPIEKKPLYHFKPSTLVFSIGGWGCNFNCIHCQNWDISQPNNMGSRKSYLLTPEESINVTKKHNCQGICWTYNEPAIWYEYTLDSARLAKEEGLYTAYVTNGFLNKEPLKEIAPFLDAYRVDFKGFNDDFYTKVCAVKNWMKVYENAVIAKELGIHVEVVTNIIPGYNDSDETLSKIAQFTFDNLGDDTVWHVTRFHPNNKLKESQSTPIETIQKAVEIGTNIGLKYIYMGNCGNRTETICPQCKAEAIIRTYPVKVNLDDKGNCLKCGYNLSVIR